MIKRTTESQRPILGDKTFPTPITKMGKIIPSWEVFAVKLSYHWAMIFFFFLENIRFRPVGLSCLCSSPPPSKVFTLLSHFVALRCVVTLIVNNANMAFHVHRKTASSVGRCYCEASFPEERKLLWSEFVIVKNIDGMHDLASVQKGDDSGFSTVTENTRLVVSKVGQGHINFDNCHRFAQKWFSPKSSWKKEKTFKK